ncbi:MAG: polysaccharide biosynthesis/export family protein [Candidatus Binataceae bacterium]
MLAIGCSDQPGSDYAAGSADAVPGVASSSSAGSQDRIEQIWEARQHDSTTRDFAIGPGDVLKISSPDLEEIKDREERVSAQDTIDLPLAGEVKVGGLTQEQAREAIQTALSRLVKDPQVDVFIQEYSGSQQVAVVGMVNKPGLYPLTSRSNTILDMIGLAGGMGASASNTVIFIPAPPGSDATPPEGLMDSLAGAQQPKQPAGATAVQVSQITAQSAAQPIQPMSAGIANNAQSPMDPASLSALLKDANPIYINIITLSRGSHRNLPVRPGDVLIVPAVGEVLVQGWVGTPGAFQITPGMTALAAITAAGGQWFSSNATVLRAGPNGEKTQIPVDLSKVEKGQEPDVPVESGDVVIVNRSVVGAVPYSLYFLASHFGAGMALPVF